MMRTLVSLFSLLALVACGAGAAATPTEGPEGASSAKPEVTSAPPSKPEPAEQVPVATGKDCATATATCDNGLCIVTVKNDCDAPVTCNVGIAAVCKSATDTGEARARGRDTVAAKASGKISVGASCQGANVMTSAVKEMQCR